MRTHSRRLFVILVTASAGVLGTAVQALAESKWK